MSTVLSASPSLVEIDHASDHSDAPLKPYVSSPSSHPHSHLNNGRRDSPKPSHQPSPARPSAPEPVSPPSTPTRLTTNAPLGNNSEHSLDPGTDSPIQLSQSQQDIYNDSSRPQDSPTKLELDRDPSSFTQGSDPEEDPDLGSGESDGDWSQEEYEADMRRVKV